MNEWVNKERNEGKLRGQKEDKGERSWDRKEGEFIGNNLSMHLCVCDQVNIWPLWYDYGHSLFSCNLDRGSYWDDTISYTAFNIPQPNMIKLLIISHKNHELKNDKLSYVV